MNTYYLCGEFPVIYRQEVERQTRENPKHSITLVIIHTSLLKKIAGNGLAKSREDIKDN